MPCSVLIHAYFWDHTWPSTWLSHWNVNGRLLRSGSNAFPWLFLITGLTMCKAEDAEHLGTRMKKKYCVKLHSASKRHTWYEWERTVLFLTQRYWEYLLQMLASLRVHGRASRWKQGTLGLWVQRLRSEASSVTTHVQNVIQWYSVGHIKRN